MMRKKDRNPETVKCGRRAEMFFAFYIAAVLMMTVFLSLIHI